MKNKNKKLNYITLINLISNFLLIDLIYSRSVHRPLDLEDPSIIVESSTTGEVYRMIDSRLQDYPFFNCFNQEHLEQNLLPEEISYRYDENKFVKGLVLNQLVNDFIKELMNKKIKFKDFIILKCTDYNTRKKSGFIIVKFKEYPFVLKLSIETPKTLTDFSTRGAQERAIFCMASSMRHLAGLTRIKSLQKIKEKVLPSHPWYDKLSLPRKWYWLPEKPEYLLIKAQNLGGNKNQFTKIPAIYGIICDEIIFSDDKPSNNECLDFCNHMNFIVDPHYKNFTFDKITGKITIIDTEYFPILMGIREKLNPVSSYIAWYARLTGRFIKNKFCMLKYKRRERQHQSYSYYRLFD